MERKLKKSTWTSLTSFIIMLIDDGRLYFFFLTKSIKHICRYFIFPMNSCLTKRKFGIIYLINKYRDAIIIYKIDLCCYMSYVSFHTKTG